ncbi:MAG TPA: serine/threonine-protein kinase [Candidatus Acidoferrum sp.]|nr:serine/threonine-protein kinase [Candidatus Acidoferrum sp.]
MKVGRYEVLDTVGAGAFSRVVRAHDPYIGRIVAVKIFPKEIASGEAREKFFQEARVIGQISHPCVLMLHDMGIDETSQTPYLVMEFVDGQPLDRILEKGTVPFPRACAWIGDIAAALGVAHRKGVIHGDVKPANILVTADGKVKLSDFGMARLASRDTAGSPLLGTPAYWCPEQIMGRPQDARSDIFSLGGVLYELLTGESPFQAESIQAVCTRVLSSTPVPVSHRNSTVPAGLEEVVMKCLMKDPALRPVGADAIAEALYPFARRKVISQPAQAQPVQQQNSLRDRAARLLRSA